MNWNDGNTTSGLGAYPIKMSGAAGYPTFSQEIPWNIGRSLVSSIPEYLRNERSLTKDIIMKIGNGNYNAIRILLEDAERNGTIVINDFKTKFKVEVEQQPEFFFDSISVVDSGVNKVLKFKMKIPDRKSNILNRDNPKIVGDIALLEMGQFVYLHFSWVAPDRNATSGQKISGKPVHGYILPEACLITDIDYSTGEVTVTRGVYKNQRSGSYTNLTLVSGSTTFAQASSVVVPQANLFFMAGAKAVSEDEMEGQIRHNYATFAEAYVQRTVNAYGGNETSEQIHANLGLESPMAQSKRIAMDMFTQGWNDIALFGEGGENYDDQGKWKGTTDGLLTNVPKSHFTTLIDIDYKHIRDTSYNYRFGSFDKAIFNKIFLDKVFTGASTRNLICGGDFFNAFSTMINELTQAVPDIRSDWKVMGKTFVTADGLTLNFIVDNRLSRKNMRNVAIMYDPSAMRKIAVKGIPETDIRMIDYENPTKSGGFIVGTQGFINTNPEACWVFQLADNASNAAGTSVVGNMSNTTYADAILGVNFASSGVASGGDLQATLSSGTMNSPVYDDHAGTTTDKTTISATKAKKTPLA
jgi:hypothetical protein